MFAYVHIHMRIPQMDSLAKNTTNKRTPLIKLNLLSKQMDNKHLAFSLFLIHQWHLLTLIIYYSNIMISIGFQDFSAKTKVSERNRVR